jgi:hypothetical protein
MAHNLSCIGTIQQVDLLNREVTVVVNRCETLMEVPRSCTVLVNGERAKLRLLQAGDSARITYRKLSQIRIADRIEAGFRGPWQEGMSSPQRRLLADLGKEQPPC